MRTTSMPLWSGKWTSMKTTSGLSGGIDAMAAVAVPNTPTQKMPGSVVSMRRRLF